MWIMTSEKGAELPRRGGRCNKELTDVESGFRQLKDVMAMRADLSNQIETAGQRAPTSFVAARWRCCSKTPRPTTQGGGGLICRRRGRCKRLSTVRLVTFRLEGQPNAAGCRGCPDARQIWKGAQARRPATAGATEGRKTVV